MIVAIDGPSASGKSTVARRVASEIGGVYVDSGSLYRGITWKALAEGVPTDDPQKIASMLSEMDMCFHLVERAVRFTIDGTDPGLELRSDEVNENVSTVAALPSVRKAVVARLREMTRFGDIVMEGRDIGTAVFPDADHKIYLDASPEERARRRLTDDKRPAGGGGPADADAVRQSLERRDAIDSTRSMDPLQVADDATVIDSTGLAVDDTVALILRTIKLREGPA